MAPPRLSHRQSKTIGRETRQCRHLSFLSPYSRHDTRIRYEYNVSETVFANTQPAPSPHPRHETRGNSSSYPSPVYINRASGGSFQRNIRHRSSTRRSTLAPGWALTSAFAAIFLTTRKPQIPHRKAFALHMNSLLLLVITPHILHFDPPAGPNGRCLFSVFQQLSIPLDLRSAGACRSGRVPLLACCCGAACRQLLKQKMPRSLLLGIVVACHRAQQLIRRRQQ